MHELILNDRKSSIRRSLETLILEGQASGPAAEMVEQDWDNIRREGLELLKLKSAPSRIFG